MLQDCPLLERVSRNVALAFTIGDCNPDTGAYHIRFDPTISARYQLVVHLNGSQLLQTIVHRPGLSAATLWVLPGTFLSTPFSPREPGPVSELETVFVSQTKDRCFSVSACFEPHGHFLFFSEFVFEVRLLGTVVASESLAGGQEVVAAFSNWTNNVTVQVGGARFLRQDLGGKR